MAKRNVSSSKSFRIFVQINEKKENYIDKWIDYEWEYRWMFIEKTTKLAISINQTEREEKRDIECLCKRKKAQIHLIWSEYPCG